MLKKNLNSKSLITAHVSHYMNTPTPTYARTKHNPKKPYSGWHTIACDGAVYSNRGHFALGDVCSGFFQCFMYTPPWRWTAGNFLRPPPQNFPVVEHFRGEGSRKSVRSCETCLEQGPGGSVCWRRAPLAWLNRYGSGASDR